MTALGNPALLERWSTALLEVEKLYECALPRHSVAPVCARFTQPCRYHNWRIAIVLHMSGKIGGVTRGVRAGNAGGSWRLRAPATTPSQRSGSSRALTGRHSLMAASSCFRWACFPAPHGFYFASCAAPLSPSACGWRGVGRLCFCPPVDSWLRVRASPIAVRP